MMRSPAKGNNIFSNEGKLKVDSQRRRQLKQNIGWSDEEIQKLER
jgi:hypothetical protein